MAETAKSDVQTVGMECAISLANSIDLDNYPMEDALAIRANLIYRFYTAIARGTTVTGEEIKKIIAESKAP